MKAFLTVLSLILKPLRMTLYKSSDSVTFAWRAVISREFQNPVKRYNDGSRLLCLKITN